MKFVSKSGNLSITLKPGLQGSPLNGTPFNPGLHIRFDNGMVTVNDEDHVKMMLNHSGYGSDFIDVKEEAIDPFAANRKESEPGHVLTGMEYGHPSKSFGSKTKPKLTPELKAALAEMAKPLAVEMAKEIIKKMAADAPEKGEEVADVEDAPEKSEAPADGEALQGPTDPSEDPDKDDGTEQLTAPPAEEKEKKEEGQKTDK